jgi:hypothetical protein
MKISSLFWRSRLWLQVSVFVGEILFAAATLTHAVGEHNAEAHYRFKSLLGVTPDLSVGTGSEIANWLSAVESIAEEREKSAKKNGITNLTKEQLQALVRAKFLEVYGMRTMNPSVLCLDILGRCNTHKAADQAAIAEIANRVSKPSVVVPPLDELEYRKQLLLAYHIMTGGNRRAPDGLFLSEDFDRVTQKQARMIIGGYPPPANFRVTQEDLVSYLQRHAAVQQKAREEAEQQAAWNRLSLDDKLLILAQQEKARLVSEGKSPDQSLFASLLSDYLAFKRTKLLEQQSQLMASQLEELWWQNLELSKQTDELANVRRAIEQSNALYLYFEAEPPRRTTPLR